jgi:hypothetical protein
MLIHPWRACEIALAAEQEYANPYTAADVWAEFIHESGRALRRPAFWDGGRTWKIRFAAPFDAGRWQWRTIGPAGDPGLHGESGELMCTADPAIDNRFYRHGFWRMSPGGRNLIHADGRAALLAADTAWALPWRATPEQVRIYAADRRAKGFNATLLMTIQPDMGARGPRDRTADEGFGVGFEDLPSGQLCELNPAYFQELDTLLAILVEHEICPVLQPVFQGFGWKGLGVAGTVVPPAEYARYCRYLVARYGAQPAIYLVGADGSGDEPQIAAGGAEIEAWDAYNQPAGIHYRPHADNRAQQDAEWLDFQWCQTGHHGEHMPERVADMWRNTPVKGVANGEPTYENGVVPGRAAGWWQGHEAWSNLCAGGTMGVVYGAGSLWQWRLHADEPGHAPYFLAAGAGWREALDFEGSRYVGLVAQILDGLPIADIEPNWQVTLGRRGLLAPDRLYIGYAEAGGLLMFMDGARVPRRYCVVDPRTGAIVREGVRAEPNDGIPDEGGAPRVYVCWQELTASQIPNTDEV